MRITDRILPAFCYAARPLVPEAIVVHYLSAIYVTEREPFALGTCRDLFIDLNSPGRKRGNRLMPKSEEPRQYASAHFLVGRDGEIWRLVPESVVAWHAGKSALNGRVRLNDWSIGIEFCASHNSGFTREQIRAGIALMIRLRSEHAIPADNVVGHDAVAVPAGRKSDPGPLFPWGEVREALAP